MSETKEREIKICQWHVWKWKTFKTESISHCKLFAWYVVQLCTVFNRYFFEQLRYYFKWRLDLPDRQTFKGEKQFCFEMDEMCENDRHSKQNEGRTDFPDTMGILGIQPLQWAIVRG